MGLRRWLLLVLVSHKMFCCAGLPRGWWETIQRMPDSHQYLLPQLGSPEWGEIFQQLFSTNTQKTLLSYLLYKSFEPCLLSGSTTDGFDFSIFLQALGKKTVESSSDPLITSLIHFFVNHALYQARKDKKSPISFYYRKFYSLTCTNSRMLVIPEEEGGRDYTFMYNDTQESLRIRPDEPFPLPAAVAGFLYHSSEQLGIEPL